MPMAALARTDDYNLPDVGDPLLSPGSLLSPGVPWANDLVTRLTTPIPLRQTPRQAYVPGEKVAFSDDDINEAIGMGMAVSGGGLSTKGIKAYHSSPHDFDRFDLSKIGTGEGAQVYGHGLYFAENPKVSGQGGQYWDSFVRHPAIPEDERVAAELLRREGFDRQKAIEYSNWNLQQLREGAEKGELSPHLTKLYAERQRQHDLLTSDKPVGPRTYEVNINADPAHFLDWDKGLHRQSPEVQSALARQLGIKADPALMRAHDDALYAALTGDPNIKIPNALPDPTGAEIYRNKIGPATVATRQLSEAGIPGIKYLDQGSRILAARANNPRNANWMADDAAWRASTPTSNYVVFDPGIVDIMKKYGIVAAPAGLGVLAAQDNYQPEERY